MSVGILLITHENIGATPDNLARYFSVECQVRLISGINLPMLLRVLNYAHQSLELLCQTAFTGGTKGVQQNIE